MPLNFAVLTKGLEALIEKRNRFIDSIKIRLEFYKTEMWAWGSIHCVSCTSRCHSLQWGHFLRMSGLFQLQEPTTWASSISSLSNLLKSITKEGCVGNLAVDHSWNADLHRIIDQELKELEKGLSLSEFPSREAGG
jgi:hypothetical protein